MRINLHNHTSRCDGKASAEDIVRAAIRGDLTHVGITDHLDSGKLRPLLGITPEQMESYVSEVKMLAEEYADQITVLAGIEVDFNRDRTDFGLFATREGAANLFRGLDFVLFEYVGDADWGGESLDALIEIRSNIHLPVGLAHPDIMKTFRKIGPAAAAHVLSQDNIFVELCPGRRNAVLVPKDGVSYESMESEIFRVRNELGRTMRLIATRSDDPNDPHIASLRAAVAELEIELRWLHFQCNRVPAYRVPHPFVEEFFDAVKQESVLLSIGTDSHEGDDKVIRIDDAVRFIEDRGLSDNIITAHIWTR